MGALQLGHNAFIGVTDEIAWGAFLPPTEWLRIISHSMKNITPYSTRPTLGNPTGIGVVAGTKSVGGDVNLEMLYQGCESLLSYCFGSPVISAQGGDGEYTWTFTPKAALFSGLGMSMRCSYDTIAADYDGLKVSSLTWSMAKDQNLQLAVTLGGRAWSAQGTPGTPTYPTDRPILESELVMTFDSTPVTNVQSLSVTISNALSFDRASLGTGYILEPQRNDLIKVNGSWTGDYIANDLTALQNLGTVKDLDFTFTSTLIIGGAIPFKCQFALPNVYIVGETPSVSSAGVVQQTINFEAVFIGSPALSVVLTNAKATSVGDGV